MRRPKLSLIIPYAERIDNLRLAFLALADQTMHRADFEVIVGVMELCEDYITLCREFAATIDIVSVISSDPFEIPRARNLAMRQARGEVMVQMDADTFLPTDGLENLFDRHFAYGQNVCVVGQVVGYGNNYDADVESVEIMPYAYWQRAIEEVGRDAEPRDPRFRVAHEIPWAFVWTGLLALPAATVRERDLFFDEDLVGWGVDDIEWGYRISQSSVPIVLRGDVYAIHLPHTRDTAANFASELVTYRQFVGKWPAPDVELAAAFSDFDANVLYPEFRREFGKIVQSCGGTLAVVRGTIDGLGVLVMGAAVDRDGQFVDTGLPSMFDDPARIDVVPLIGLALPYEDDTFDECRLLPAIGKFSEKYSAAIIAAAERVARRVVSIGEGATC